MENYKIDYRTHCGIGFRHFNTAPEEMQTIWNPNVTHSHPYYEIFYLVSGECTYKVANRIYSLTPGDAICIQAFQNHSISVNPDINYERYVLEFEMTNIPSLNGVTPLYDIFENDIPVLFLSKNSVDNSKILEIFQDMEKYCLNKNVFTNHFVLADTIKLASQIRINFEKVEDNVIAPTVVNAKYEEILNKISNYINANVSRKISIDDIARNVYLSRSHLQHLFKQYVGMPITDYILQQKMHVARYMLQNGTPLNEVSDALGYKYYSTFCMHFKKTFGHTPKNHCK